MSVVAIESAVETALLALSELDARQTLDYGTWEPIAAGDTDFQLRLWQPYTDARNSNAKRDVAQVQLAVHHHLADPFDERAYTQADLLTLLDTITEPSWWLLAGVHSVLEGPEVTDGPERVGRVLTFTLSVLLVSTGT